MLTPLEIENRKFKREMGGYSKVEVEEFMRVISENYELIYKENLANKDKINMLSNAIKQYKSMEEALQNAILVAQNAGDEVVQNAKRNAENIIKDAENKATQLLADASREVTRVSYEYEEMRRNVEVFRTRIISLLTSQLEIVKEFSMPADREIEGPVKKIKHSPIEINEESDIQHAEAKSKLKQLEQMTMELPKIVVNEKGEYVAAEELAEDTNKE
jgi:cell division initiation protein